MSVSGPVWSDSVSSARDRPSGWPWPLLTRAEPNDHPMIALPRGIYDGLIQHATEGAPAEVCGVLGGDYGQYDTSVESAHRAENAAERPRTEYYIDPVEQLDLVEAIEDRGEDVAGFYHSHPAGPPDPSETDAARAAWPGLSYLVVVLDGDYPYVGSWRWNDEDETFEQEVLQLQSGSVD